MQRPSILFINRVYPPVRGASGRLLRDLARAFAREGWEVTVITTGLKASKERDGGIKVIRVRGKEKPSGVLSYCCAWVRMSWVALRYPATNLIVTMSDPPMIAVAGRLLKRIKKNRHMHWCQDLYPDLFPALGARFPGFLMDRMMDASRRAMNDADKVVTIGRCMASHIAATVDTRKISVIPNWPDYELVRPPAGADAVPEVSGVDGSKPFESQLKHGPKFRVLYAGNIGRAHPLQTILGAAEILDHQHPEVEFVFVGDGPRFDEVARERVRRGLHNIRLLPFQPLTRLRQVMESGDVHIVSLKDDAAGLLVPSKVYAAMAAGRPCLFIGPSESEAARVIHDFRAGAVIQQGDAEALADQIRRYRLNGEEWFAAHEGAAKAGKIFVPEESVRAWIERAWAVVEPDWRAQHE